MTGFAEVGAWRGKRVQATRNPSGDVVITVLSVNGVVIVHAVVTAAAFRELTAVLSAEGTP